jgi:predicted phage-related endonuclease
MSRVNEVELAGRQTYLGGSDTRTIMGHDEEALIRLWREKRGEIKPEDLSTNLVVQFGVVTEELNRRWFERQTGCRLGSVSCATPSSTGWEQRLTE